jgi:pyruvate dehydrogenase E1 component beta subunit
MEFMRRWGVAEAGKITAGERPNPAVNFTPTYDTTTMPAWILGVSFDIPPEGASGVVSESLAATPIGKAAVRRHGEDLAIISAGVGVHRALEAADRLAAGGVQSTVLDLRSIAPLDRSAILEAAARTGHVVVVDEDYVRGGLTGEIAALIAEERIDARFARVAVEETIPFARKLENAALPNTGRIVAAAERCLDLAGSSA